MAAYIRELCRDYAVGRIDHLEAIDIEIGVQRLRAKEVIQPVHLAVVRRYLAGYTVAELQFDYPNVEELLVSFFSALADEIGYSDERVVQQALRRNPAYARTIDAYRRKLEQYGRTFDTC